MLSAVIDKGVLSMVSARFFSVTTTSPTVPNPSLFRYSQLPEARQRLSHAQAAAELLPPSSGGLVAAPDP